MLPSENTNQAITESYSKPKRGRPKGTGKTFTDKWIAARGLHPATAAEILAWHDERSLWRRLLSSEDDSILLRTLVFLTEMRDGKASQKLAITQQTLNITIDDLDRARAIVSELRSQSLVGTSPSNQLATNSNDNSIMVQSDEGGGTVVG